MSDLETIRAAIVATMSRVSDIGRINDYERYAASLDALKALYVAEIAGDRQLRGWVIRRISTNETTVALGRWDVRHGWEIRGYMALADLASSEKVFDGLIEGLRAEFRDDDTLGGVVDTCISADGEALSLVESMPVLFAGVLCHSAKLRLTTNSTV